MGGRTDASSVMIGNKALRICGHKSSAPVANKGVDIVSNTALANLKYMNGMSIHGKNALTNNCGNHCKALRLSKEIDVDRKDHIRIEVKVDDSNEQEISRFGISSELVRGRSALIVYIRPTDGLMTNRRVSVFAMAKSRAKSCVVGARSSSYSVM